MRGCCAHGVTGSSVFKTPTSPVLTPRFLAEGRGLIPKAPSRRDMERFVLVLLFLDVVSLAAGQHPLRTGAGPWRHHIQWENNGQVYSLMSTGTQYRAPAQVRKRTQLLLTTKSHSVRHQSPGELTEPPRTAFRRTGEGNNAVMNAPRVAATRQINAYRSPRVQVNSTSRASSPPQEFSGSGVPRGGRSTLGNHTGAQRATSPLIRSQSFTQSRGGRVISIAGNSESGTRSAGTARRVTAVGVAGNEPRSPPQDSQRAQTPTRLTPESNLTGLTNNAVELNASPRRPDTTRTTDTSDPRDPHSIHHRNSVFYQLYPPDSRNRVPVRPSPGQGYGTSFFHNGECVCVCKSMIIKSYAANKASHIVYNPLYDMDIK